MAEASAASFTILQGQLLLGRKFGERGHFVWAQFEFVLMRTLLSYYKLGDQPCRNSPVASMWVSGARLSRADEDTLGLALKPGMIDHKFAFQLRSLSGIEWVLAASTVEGLTEWCSALQELGVSGSPFAAPVTLEAQRLAVVVKESSVAHSQRQGSTTAQRLGLVAVDATPKRVVAVPSSTPCASAAPSTTLAEPFTQVAAATAGTSDATPSLRRRSFASIYATAPPKYRDADESFGTPAAEALSAAVANTESLVTGTESLAERRRKHFEDARRLQIFGPHRHEEQDVTGADAVRVDDDRAAVPDSPTTPPPTARNPSHPWLELTPRVQNSLTRLFSLVQERQEALRRIAREAVMESQIHGSRRPRAKRRRRTSHNSDGGEHGGAWVCGSSSSCSLSDSGSGKGQGRRRKRRPVEPAGLEGKRGTPPRGRRSGEHGAGGQSEHRAAGKRRDDHTSGKRGEHGSSKRGEHRSGTRRARRAHTSSEPEAHPSAQPEGMNWFELRV